MPSLQNEFSDRQIFWHFETPCLFSATVATHHGRQFLLVERLPDGGWDWVTWGQDQRSHPLHGQAITARLAMTAAAHAAWVESGGIARARPKPIAATLQLQAFDAI